jgi:Flp pilus assembly CpaF family ATPase
VQLPHSREPSESQARRASALKSALGPLLEFLADDLVVEVMLNADGAVWVEREDRHRDALHGRPDARH